MEALKSDDTSKLSLLALGKRIQYLEGFDVVYPALGFVHLFHCFHSYCKWANNYSNVNGNHKNWAIRGHRLETIHFHPHQQNLCHHLMPITVQNWWKLGVCC